MRKIIVMVAIMLLSFSSKIAAAETTPAPYLYYYSRMLGGIIIERADGTDSRLIGADLIPPEMSGLQGAGWSPSGHYFVAGGMNYGDYNSSVRGIFLIDNQGQQPVDFLATAGNAYHMEWSPNGDDLLMIVGNESGQPLAGHDKFFFWLVNPTAKKVLGEFGTSLGLLPYTLGDFEWDSDNQNVTFAIAPDDFPDQYYRVTMFFNGQVIKHPISEAEFNAQDKQVKIVDNTDPFSRGYGLSASRRYEASGKYPTLLLDQKTGTTIELPTHSQGTICRTYEWNADEQYIITLDGTLLSGGGCYSSVLGVTDSQGKLWRELGGCSWDVPPCAGWLPPQVDVNAPPSGQPKPIQLDPLAFEPTNDQQVNIRDESLHFRCARDSERNIVEKASETIQFTLHDGQRCPYNRGDSFSDEGLPIVVAYDSDRQLLATFMDYLSDKFVSIWKMCPNGIGIRILKLNTYGFQLEFTPDGEQLRARNYNAWKIYDVDDILASATAQCETATS